MRHRIGLRTLGFSVAVVGLVSGMFAWWAQIRPAAAEPWPAAALSDGLITHVQQSEGRPTRVIVVDPRTRVMAVYDLARDSGVIQLKSVRNLSADLKMTYWNSDGLTPNNIQKQIDRQ